MRIPGGGLPTGLPARPGDKAGRGGISAQNVQSIESQRFISSRVHLLFAGKQRKVMTYNAENFYRFKDKTTHELRVRKDEKAVRALAQVILSENPDVVALQEVGDDGLLKEFNQKYLRGRYPHVSSSLVRNGLGIQRVAFLSKQNMKPVEIISHWKEQCGDLAHLEQGNGTCGKRDFLETTFETDTGYRFTVFNAHFKSMIGGERKTNPIRMKEAQSAAKVLNAKFQEDAKAPLMVVGDFNTLHHTRYGKPVIRTLTMKNDKNPDNDLTETLLKDGKNKPTHRGDRKYAPAKLDYMFVSKSLLEQVRKAYVVGRFDRGPVRWASDHRPMVTVFEEPDEVAQPAGKPVHFAGSQATASKLDLIA